MCPADDLSGEHDQPEERDAQHRRAFQALSAREKDVYLYELEGKLARLESRYEQQRRFIAHHHPDHHLATEEQDAPLPGAPRGGGLDDSLHDLLSALEGPAGLLSALLAATPSHFILFDLQRRYVYLNPTALSAVGWDAASVLGKTWRELGVSEVLGARFEERFARVIETGEPLTYEDSMPLADGVEHHFATTLSPVHDRAGRLVAIASSNADITARLQNETRRVALAVEHERSRVLSDFIRDAAHEFRTPLATIHSDLSLLPLVTSGPEQDAIIGRLQAAAHGIGRLVDGLITMSRLDLEDISLTMRGLDVNTLLIGLARELVPAEGRWLHLELDPDLPHPLGDPGHLTRALREVMVNAVRFTRPNDAITLRTELAAGQIRVTIADAGPGMPAETAGRAFERFYRHDTAHTSAGFGLGLPIARKIVALHDGTISLESTPGQGTRVIIALPAPPEPGSGSGQEG